MDFFEKMDNMDIVSRVFPAVGQYLDEATDFIDSVMECLEPDSAQLFKINVSFEELFINVSHYAYPDSSGEVLVEVAVSDGIVAIRLTDGGVPFNPLLQEAPDLSIPLQERKEGGFGITIVKEFMDYTEYVYDNDKNIFTMMKRIK